MKNIARTIMLLTTMLLLPLAVAAAESDRDDKEQKAVAAAEQNDKHTGVILWHALNKLGLHIDAMELVRVYYDNQIYFKLLAEAPIDTSSAICSLAFHPKKRLLASCDALQVMVHTFTTTHQPPLLTASDDRFSPDRVTFIDDGEQLAYDICSSGHDSHNTAMWNYKTGEISLIPHDNQANIIGYVQDEKLLVTINEAQITFWDDGITKTKHATLDVGHSISVKDAITISPNGSMIAFDHEGVVRLWEKPWSSKPRVAIKKDKPVRALKFSHDGKFLAILRQRENITLLECATNSIVELQHGYPCGPTLAFSKNRLLAAASLEGISLWDADRLQPLGSYHDKIESIAFSPDGSLLAAGVSDISRNASIKIWQQQKDFLKEGFDAARRQEFVEHEMLPLANLVPQKPVVAPSGFAPSRASTYGERQAIRRWCAKHSEFYGKLHA